VSESLVFPIRSDKLSVNVAVTSHVHHRQTEFQAIDIYDSEVFGRMLLLDGHIQLTEFDEHAYHEALVQIPLMALDHPRSALVVGGGDGGVIRELCRCGSLEHIDIVEIDSGVIEAVRQYMPSVPGDAFNDPRVTVRVADAFPFVKKAPRKYDLIVVDSTDTYEDEEGALSEMLFTQEFYRDCRNALTDEGLVVTQADNLVFCPYSMVSIRNLFGEVFPRIGTYQALVPSFGGFSGFVWASLGSDVRTEFKPDPGFSYLNEATYQLAFTPLHFSPRS
jgi:spermidine synthase